MELRKDYILDRWVIISEKRGIRPKEFSKINQKSEGNTCYFCPGNEHLTPPEIARKEKNGKWYIRVFPNKFPFVMVEGNPVPKTDNDFYTFASAFGSHEVVAETPNHEEQMGSLSVEHIADIFGVYRDRINELGKDERAAYVTVFKNHGGEAGTSLVHSHTQIASINITPPEIAREIIATKRYAGCPYCKIIKKETDSYRKCFENDSFIAFTPYASRFNYEIWVFSNQHLRTLNDFDDKMLYDLAEIMKKILLKLKELNASYNFFIHYSPSGEDLHFHIELIPRLANWAGFEYSSGIIVNSVSPESAAEFYRG